MINSTLLRPLAIGRTCMCTAMQIAQEGGKRNHVPLGNVGSWNVIDTNCIYELVGFIKTAADIDHV